jgi:hypothetical protein
MWRTWPPGYARGNGGRESFCWIHHDRRGTDMRHCRWNAARFRHEGSATIDGWRMVNRVRRRMNCGKRRKDLDRQ